MDRAGQLNSLLTPTSVAVVGASPRENSWGRTTLENLRAVGFTGEVYPVNPQWDEVEGLACYPSLDALPAVPDVAAVAVAAGRVPDVIDQAIRCGIPAAVVYASGFGAAGQGEGGDAGTDGPRARVAALVSDARIAVLGPNCLGLVNYHARAAMWGITVPVAHAGTQSGVAVIAQSGNIALTIAGANRGVGLTHLISCGNQLGASVAELITACLDDPAVRVIAVVLEGTPDPLRLRTALETAAVKDVPVVVLKLGRSSKGQAATLAHTGTLSGEPALYRALFRQFGVVQVDDVDELLSAAALLSGRRAARAQGVAFFASSGGECGLLSDLADELGVQLPEIPEDCATRITALLPEYARVSNPLDFTAGGWGNVELYRDIATELAAVPSVDTIIAVHDAPTLDGQDGGDDWPRIIEGLGAGSDAVDGQGVVVANVNTIGDVRAALPAALRERGVVPLTGLRSSMSALAKVGTRARLMSNFEQRPSAQLDAERVQAAVAILDTAPAGVLSEAAAKDVMDALGVRTPARCLATGNSAAIRAAGQIGYPVVAKISSSRITHKSDIGGVVIGIEDDESMLVASMQLARIAGEVDPISTPEILIEEMVPAGLELIVGARRDEHFGPVVMTGLGGVLTELLNDVSHRLAPMSVVDARLMIDELTGARLLDGYRGAAPADRDALVDVLLRVSELMTACPRIVELDLNPVLWSADRGGFVAVDALVVLD